jgi:Flp pilus assembly protein TadG
MNVFQRFRSDQRGNVAILFGLALLPVVGMVGAAVDYSRANAVRAALQAAADAAALTAARDASGLSEARIAERARGVFAANFNRKDATLGPIEVVKGDKTVRVAASATVKTSIMAIMHVDTIKVATAGEVAWGRNRIELALVLDNTGSMSTDGKMPALKAAVRDLISDLEKSSDRDMIKVSIVPFDTQVNIGTRFRNESWLTFDAGLDRSLRVDRRHWEGCVVDREKPHDSKDYGGVSRSDYPAAKCETGSLARVQPLTNDFRALRETVDAMRPSGYTNITIGMTWGLASLSRGEPFSEAEPFGTRNLKKYMVVLTDGDNTRNRFSNDHREIDERTRLACREVKDSGVTLFTIRVVAGNRQLLRDCASTTDLYREVKDASEIQPAFRRILNEIKAIRLTS